MGRPASLSASAARSLEAARCAQRPAATVFPRPHTAPRLRPVARYSALVILSLVARHDTAEFLRPLPRDLPAAWRPPAARRPISGTDGAGPFSLWHSCDEGRCHSVWKALGVPRGQRPVTGSPIPDSGEERPRVFPGVSAGPGRRVAFGVVGGPAHCWAFLLTGTHFLPAPGAGPARLLKTQRGSSVRGHVVGTAGGRGHGRRGPAQ